MHRRIGSAASGGGFRIVWPLLAVGALIALDRGAGFDQWLADRIFAWEGHRWALKHAFATETLVHRWGKALSLLAWCCALLALCGSWCSQLGSAWRRPLAYLVLAVLASVALTAWIKGWSNMDCPWDLSRYGGDRPFVGLFEVRPVGLPRGRCFPAAHSSAGYAWVALYFFLAWVRPHWRWAGLGAGLGLGIVFGVSQQLRGAHFLSHDLLTFALCWTTAAALHALILDDGQDRGTPASATGGTP